MILLIRELHSEEQEPGAGLLSPAAHEISWLAIQSTDASLEDFYVIGLGCDLGIELSLLSSPSDFNVQPSWESLQSTSHHLSSQPNLNSGILSIA